MKFLETARWSISALIVICTPLDAQTVEIPAQDYISDDTNSDGYSLSYLTSEGSAINGIYKLPEISKTQATPSTQKPVFIRQDVLTLAGRKFGTRSLDSVLDLSVLEKSSVYRNSAKIKVKVSSTQASEISSGLAEISAAYKDKSEKNQTADCKSVAISVKHRVAMDTSTVLEVVESEVSANPGCACEIVKTAINTSEADIAGAADITEVAISAAPEQMRMISQCAIAAMPEALPAIQAILAKLDTNSGDSYSSKDSKDSKSGKDEVASRLPPIRPMPPLDIPPPYVPPITPPPNVPPVSNPNPKGPKPPKPPKP